MTGRHLFRNTKREKYTEPKAWDFSRGPERKADGPRVRPAGEFDELGVDPNVVQMVLEGDV